ncbi:multifunctional CCA addition/repair protein [Ideonella sp.]|uniref:multifunctional CCA addition/repair protein n=1 Tax=Ideonella sp. TaxID=1929293 RepID=UPI002B479DF3|nr:multifunctional CCA addition/repair protein [Ideonella sp.]HJV71783.1 multifunctional CCA addition/repair protein [Ideonella sp.]
MKRYIVGGAVRDALLGRPVNDRDWVVVGSTPEAMVAAGYTPVGKDFPVFLHPQTHEEHALARTERKTAPGYRGFVVHADPAVTLEDDLRRRDLTINAIAQDEHGALIDPYDGRRDLEAKVLRHVSEAFAEDPVRILRLARFAARFHDFSVAPETMALVREMVEAGEVDALVPERVWQELATGLMEPKPSRMLQVLREGGALARLLPEVERLYGVPQPEAHHPEVDTGHHLELVLDQAAAMDAPLTVRFACLCHDLGKGTTRPDEWPRHIGHEGRSERLARALAARLKAPTEATELAAVVAREHTNIHRATELGPAALLRLIERCDAFRRPERFAQALLACEIDARGRLGLEQRDYPSRPLLTRAFEAAAALPTADVAAAAMARGAQGEAIAKAIHQARAQAIAAALACESGA